MSNVLLKEVYSKYLYGNIIISYIILIPGPTDFYMFRKKNNMRVGHNRLGVHQSKILSRLLLKCLSYEFFNFMLYSCCLGRTFCGKITHSDTNIIMVSLLTYLIPLREVSVWRGQPSG